MDFDRVCQQVKDDAFLLGVFDFFFSCRQFGFASSVDDMHIRAKTQGGSCGIHCHVAAADDNSFLCAHDRCPGIFAEGLHQVGAGQVFIGGEDAECLLAGDVHESGQAGTAADEDSLKAFLVHQVINGDGLADDDVCFDFDAKRSDIVNFLFNNRILGKTEFRNAVDKDAACLVQCFEDRYIIAHPGKIACACQTGRAGADDRDLFVFLFRCDCGFDTHFLGGVGDISFQLADGNSFALDASDAFAFTL